MNINLKLLKKGITGFVIATTITGCSKNVDCNIMENHIHLYINESNGVKMYINGEKESKNGFERTNDYIICNDDMTIVCKNNLCLISDNVEYLTNTYSQMQPKRQVYIYDYVYGSYYGYGYGYNVSSGKYEYGYGLIIGYHYEYVWKDIDMNTCTENRVRYITYKFKFYKIEEDGNISFKYFDSLDKIEAGYNYFKIDDLIKKEISDSYYLNEKIKK